MFCGVALALILHAQPVCTLSQFQESMQVELAGEHEIVAMAIFNDYLDRINAISFDLQNEWSSPLEKIQHKNESAIQAALLFDELLSSLGIVTQSKSWSIALSHLRRTVLLTARQYRNPWRSVVWANIPKDSQLNNDVVLKIDQFLQMYAGKDRQDRFDALIALLNGDSDKCRLIENRVMHRWIEYLQLVSEIDGLEFEKQLYPLLDQGKMVHNAVVWIAENIDDAAVIRAAVSQFKLWQQLNLQQKNAYKKLVTETRARTGVDPLSTVCGSGSIEVSRVMNQLLQMTGEMRELNTQAEQKILQLLSREQLGNVSFTGKMFSDDVLPFVQ